MAGSGPCSAKKSIEVFSSHLIGESGHGLFPENTQSDCSRLLLVSTVCIILCCAKYLNI